MQVFQLETLTPGIVARGVMRGMLVTYQERTEKGLEVVKKRGLDLSRGGEEGRR